MAETSATYIYDSEQPSEVAYVAVWGGADNKASGHALHLAAAKGKSLGGPRVVTGTQLNKGGPVRLYPLLPAHAEVS
jgi:hypothetical protein